MEEAEALATNVAIMGTKMLASGTLISLQEMYGGAFSVRAVRLPGVEKNGLQALVNELFEGRAREYEDRNGQITFLLPHDKRALGSIMRIMEGLKGDVVSDGEQEEPGGSSGIGGSAAKTNGGLRVIGDYTITGPTLEEVFMNVAREAGATGEV
jgi:ATP-binding cassette subfamily A (ABC1) protein 3